MEASRGFERAVDGWNSISKDNHHSNREYAIGNRNKQSRSNTSNSRTLDLMITTK